MKFLHESLELKNAYEIYKKKRFLHSYFLFSGYFLDENHSERCRNAALDGALFSALKAKNQELYEGLIKTVGEWSAAQHHKAGLSLFKKDYENFWDIIVSSPKYSSQRFFPWSRGLNSLPVTRNWFGNGLNAPSIFSDFSEDNFFSDEVCLFSADSNYFLKFSSIPLESAKKVGWNIHFHFHVINPTDEVFARKADYVKRFNVSFSYEYTSKPSKAYYASSRYIVAHELMLRSNRALWIMDIDLRYKESPESLFTKYGWKKNRIGIRKNNRVSLPWQSICANAMYVPCTNKGKNYLENVSVYLWSFFESSDQSDLWWIDQNALLFGFINTLENSPEEWQVWGWRLDKILKLPTMFSDKMNTITSD